MEYKRPGHPPWSASYGTSNRITNTGFVYDAAGNMTNDGLHSYTYDAENRLTAVDGGTTASYVYNSHGQRVLKTAGGVTTEYYHDLSGNVLGEAQGTTVTTGYVYFNQQLLAEYTGGTTYFVHQDHLGSTRLMTNVTGGRLSVDGLSAVRRANRWRLRNDSQIYRLRARRGIRQRLRPCKVLRFASWQLFVSRPVCWTHQRSANVEPLHVRPQQSRQLHGPERTRPRPMRSRLWRWRRRHSSLSIWLWRAGPEWPSRSTLQST